MKSSFRVAALVALLAACTSHGPQASPTPSPAPKVDEACATAVRPLVDVLGRLDSELDLGLTFTDYRARLVGVRDEYDKVQFSQLKPECLRRAAIPAELAWNKHRDAYTAWETCVKSTACTADKVPGALDPHLTEATGHLGRAAAALP